MAPVLSKEAVLVGPVDFLCLVCESYYINEQDVVEHVAEPQHTSNIHATHYVEKYKNDRIRKIKKLYFCEFCNIVLSTLTKVGLHVEDQKHSFNKSLQIIQRVGKHVTVSENISIDEDVWHGVIDNTCTLCNVEFEDKIDHTNETAHIINLIQSQLSNTDGNVYRKVDDVFHCLTCNKIVAEISSHLTDSKHMELLQEYHKETPPTPIETSTCVTTTCVTSTCNTSTCVTSTCNTSTCVTSTCNTSTCVTSTCNTSTCVTSTCNTSTCVTTASTTSKCVMESTKEIKTEENTSDKDEVATSTSSDSNKVENILVNRNIEEVKTHIENDKKSDLKHDRHICKALNAENYIICDLQGITWCMICDLTVKPGDTKSHVMDMHHEVLLNMHKKRGKNLKICVKNESDKDMADIVDSVQKFQSNYINIDFLSSTAVCKKCTTNVEFNSKAIDNHIKEHREEEEGIDKTITTDVKDETAKNIDICEKDENTATITVDEKKDHDEQIKSLSQIHGLQYNCNDNTLHCPKCDKNIAMSVKSIKRHLKGLAHSNIHDSDKSNDVSTNLNDVKKKSNDDTEISNDATKSSSESSSKIIDKTSSLIRVPAAQYIVTLAHVENGIHQDVIINEKYCIAFCSLMLTTPVYLGQVKCNMCGINFISRDMTEHFDDGSHEKIFKSTSVIIYSDSEFIREIFSNTFHCGFCNVVYYSFDDLENHLKTTAHKESQAHSIWRFRRYMAEVKQKNPEKQSLQQVLLSNMRHN